ncbi:M28 family peptidase [Dyadobacter fanqingshengii]|uniref:M28 family peptidase n=1 Tax=Dyadobacter fanqingshengii TaxID=2906443 RepID=A0A9X1PEK9_9BACT|nr:M28 family peptidase [Dyadobacter fanqingshengii]MCF0043571.1 M28 family peptidase [Dyadobacter fanqingshengii]USJ34811.1 M28 family peptidase [Dyadobacter fanqingshengii]
MKKLSILMFVLVLAYGCKTKESSEQTAEQAPKLVKSPDFNADSAYKFVQKQVDFGPRVPDTKPHDACGDYLAATLKSYGLQVIQQAFKDTTFDNKILNGRNIIGSFNPTASKRILLAAHWDSRPYSDQDSVTKNKPVLAANDGASGVGILLEVARVLSLQKPTPEIGVDIVFFDMEDWGNSEQADDEYGGYCLGSQYWAANKHTPNYTAYFGILLDMVGAKGATFFKEGHSVQLAGSVVNSVWNTASRLGYSNFFIDDRGGAITDDHVPVNKIAKIPMIDIIHTKPNNLSKTFFDQWHTTDDTMEHIDPKTLKAVGQTLIQVVYQEAEGEAL